MLQKKLIQGKINSKADNEDYILGVLEIAENLKPDSKFQKFKTRADSASPKLNK